MDPYAPWAPPEVVEEVIRLVIERSKEDERKRQIEELTARAQR